MANDELISKYVHALSSHLKGLWPKRARILEEVEAHLTEAAALSSPAQAISDFGPVEHVARRFAEERLRASLSDLRWFGVGFIGLLLTINLEALVPLAPVFRAPELLPPEVTLMWSLGLVAHLAGGVAFLYALRHRVVDPFGAGVAFNGAFVGTLIGVGLVSFGNHFGGLFTNGTSSLAPVCLRCAVVIALSFRAVPFTLAQQALDLTRRRVGFAR